MGLTSDEIRVQLILVIVFEGFEKIRGDTYQGFGLLWLGCKRPLPENELFIFSLDFLRSGYVLYPCLVLSGSVNVLSGISSWFEGVSFNKIDYCIIIHYLSLLIYG